MEHHIIPRGDAQEHEENKKCACNPYVQYEGDDELVIHQSYDGRELFEYCIDYKN